MDDESCLDGPKNDVMTQVMQSSFIGVTVTICIHLSPLIPTPNFLTGFITCTSLKDKRIQILTLDDQSLGVHRISHNTTHNSTIPPRSSPSPSSSNIPPPNVAWEAYYPKGAINPTAPIPGGFSFHLSGPPFFSKALEGAKEVVMSYRPRNGIELRGEKFLESVSA